MCCQVTGTGYDTDVQFHHGFNLYLQRKLLGGEDLLPSAAWGLCWELDEVMALKTQSLARLWVFGRRLEYAVIVSTCWS